MINNRSFKNTVTLILGFIFLSGFGFGPDSRNADETFTLITASGYSSKTMIYRAKGEEKDISVIALHGKSGRPDTPHMIDLYNKLNQKGYTVVAITMPWSKNKREGTFQDALDIINEAVTKSEKQEMVILGHSMGGMFALQYGAGNPANPIVGIIPVAPGHDLQLAKKLRDKSAESVLKAKQMMAKGKGKERETFNDFNAGRSTSFDTTAEYYVAFYDPDSLPGMKAIAPENKLPVLWVAGTGDKLTEIYHMAELFELLPENSRNRYLEASGTHKSVLDKSAFNIADWIDQLQ